MIPSTASTPQRDHSPARQQLNIPKINTNINSKVTPKTSPRGSPNKASAAKLVIPTSPGCMLIQGVLDGYNHRNQVGEVSEDVDF